MIDKQKGEILMYTTEDGLTKIEVELREETVWLSLDQMAELFQRDKSTVSRHIKNIFTEGELARGATVAKIATVQNEGDRQVERMIECFNLDVIISVGYRVKSLRGTQFRIWASSVLKEYIKKGFAMNDSLLKNAGGGNYFDELLARIRDIRSSEKVFYRKVLDNYAVNVIMMPPASVKKPFARCDGSCDFSDIPTCTIPKPSIISPIARISPNIKSLKLFTTPTGSFADAGIYHTKSMAIVSARVRYTRRTLFDFLSAGSFSFLLFLLISIVPPHIV